MAYSCRAWEDLPDCTRDMLKCVTKHTVIVHAETFAIVVFAVGHMLQLALVTTSPISPTLLLFLIKENHNCIVFELSQLTRIAHQRQDVSGHSL